MARAHHFRRGEMAEGAWGNRYARRLAIWGAIRALMRHLERFLPRYAARTDITFPGRNFCPKRGPAAIDSSARPQGIGRIDLRQILAAGLVGTIRGKSRRCLAVDPCVVGLLAGPGIVPNCAE